MRDYSMLWFVVGIILGVIVMMVAGYGPNI